MPLNGNLTLDLSDSDSSENSIIMQLDGNVSLDDTDTAVPNDTLDFPNSSLDSTDEQSSDQSSSIPKIYSGNARSIFPKYIDFVDKLVDHRIDVAQISETWQDVKKDDHKQKIELLENKHGYKWYSFARQKF